jgi:D-alanyl-D-alanine carboxypeptidase/D-alanyl-D-alanine-endopeptidase (penicillin-binding protein 4)
MRKTFILFGFSMLNLLAFCQNPLDILIKNSLLENANISLLVKDLNTNQTLYQYCPKNSLTPASTMKLVTTATALEMLGPDFCFKTTLAIDGKITKDSILQGNLYIHGSGDPTIGSEKTGDAYFLTKWVQAVKAAGINKINGQIIADASAFDDEGVNPHWTWEDIGNYYAAGAYGIAYKDNTCRVVLHSGNEDTTPEILRTMPEIKGLTFENYLKSTKINYDSAYFYGAPHSNLRIIRGEIPANKTEFIVKCDIPNPGLLLAEHFQLKLIQSGVSVSQKPTDIVPYFYNSKVIYTHLSPTLSQIITETNIHSNNLYAEQVFRYLGFSGKSTSNQAIKNIRSFWKLKGLPVEELFQLDGCGLSPSDAVSAEFLVDLLIFMNKSPNKDVFFNSLPVAGESGTLSNFLKNTDLKGKVHAKSGTITRVKSFAGYLDANNKKIVFALLINNANGGSKEVTRKIEEFLLQLSVNSNQ